MNDGEVTKLSQRNDTLFEYKCYSNRPCLETPSSHYKVLDLKSKNNSFIFKLERLDTLQLPKRFPDNRYSILVFRGIDSTRISFVQQLFGLSKKDVTNNFVDTFKTDNKFGFTYFSSNYYDNLKKLKTITNKAEVEEIASLFKTEKFVRIVELYKISHPSDMYASGLSAELFNQACIDKGYNPIGTGRIANELMRK
ncbi:MAG: hypothetical protein WKF85_07845 [Chitinophagaceae bacterium]